MTQAAFQQRSADTDVSGETKQSTALFDRVGSLRDGEQERSGGGLISARYSRAAAAQQPGRTDPGSSRSPRHRRSRPAGTTRSSRCLVGSVKNKTDKHLTPPSSKSSHSSDTFRLSVNVPEIGKKIILYPFWSRHKTHGLETIVPLWCQKEHCLFQAGDDPAALLHFSSLDMRELQTHSSLKLNSVTLLHTMAQIILLRFLGETKITLFDLWLFFYVYFLFTLPVICKKMWKC